MISTRHPFVAIYFTCPSFLLWTIKINLRCQSVWLGAHYKIQKSLRGGSAIARSTHGPGYMSMHVQRRTTPIPIGCGQNLGLAHGQPYGPPPGFVHTRLIYGLLTFIILVAFLLFYATMVFCL